MTDLAKQHGLPAENLISPELVRRFCWSPPAEAGEPAVAAALAAGGARRWQIELVAAPLSAALLVTAGEAKVT